MKPHICCYSTSNAHVARSADKESRSDLGYAELFFEVKADPMYDFYTDPPQDATVEARAAHSLETPFDSIDGTYSAAAREAVRALGQHVAYATEIFARQFRVFLFSVSMSGSRARLIRWDRSGCVVSESFDIREQPEFLCEFLWRFSQGSQASRGHDVTIEPALLDEEIIFHTLVREQTGFQLGVQDAELDAAVLRHYTPGKVWAVYVLTQDAVGEEPRALRYIISRPVVSPVSLDGHATRGYWAVEISTRRVVFLKDTWRHRAPALEGDTLRTLAAAGVRNIPSVVADADVPHRLPPYGRELIREDFQTTRTDGFPSQPWVCRGGLDALHIRRRSHYRLVLATVGYDLSSMQSSSELLHAGYDVFTAMQDALTKGSRVHRDISVGNIVLVREGNQAVRKGYLIDWEYSCKADEGGVACNEDRVGTWLFMSIKTLARRHIGKHTFQDDTESLLYVILYCALLWLPHNLSKEELTAAVYEMFERSTTYGGRKCGGDGKAMNAATREFTDYIKFKSGAIQRWLDAFMNFHAPDPEDEASKGKWNNPGHLDGFWFDFLKTETLDVDDRVDNERRIPAYPPRLLIDLSASSGSTTSVSSDWAGGPVDAEPPEADPAVSLGRRSRSEDRNPSVTSHLAKRARAALAPEDPSGPTEPPSLRRSTRPRKRPDRGVPSTEANGAGGPALREADAAKVSLGALASPTSRRGKGRGASHGTSSSHK
ncbi:hypothetical protein K466DRAFT_598575 [Polyporus arcularius HHB13444]|uniref:Fungal-type protein kinase domain-containing protein n=1 Tax=Polyporus arcularius HHB13444 TaxID=1314778 RepID=A0A5C3PHX0_9APHY|nr:hypothetical protein K466DRAFT_598575 [Polyporus arcularius HHB13444]